MRKKTSTDTKRKASATKRRTKGAKGISKTTGGKANNGASPERMAELRAARTSLGGRPKLFVKPKKAGWNSRAITRLGRDGCESVDIIRLLELRPLLADSAERREQFDSLVAMAHSEFKVRLQSWLIKAAAKGGSNSIKSLAGVWLDRFSEHEADRWKDVTTSASDRIMRLIEKHKKATTRNKKDAAQV